MKIEKELCDRFPAVLRDKLLRNEIELPDTAMFHYNKILVYRAVERTKEDDHDVTRDDFLSYYELHKTPKTPKGSRNKQVKDFTKDPHYYGVSSFFKISLVKQIMKFPNPHKKIAVGYVYPEGGPQETKNQHVCWWLYENVDVSGFVLVKEENDG